MHTPQTTAPGGATFRPEVDGKAAQALFEAMFTDHTPHVDTRTPQQVRAS